MHQDLPEDATCRQVQALCPESTDCTDSTSIHKIAQYPQQQGRHNFRGRGAFRGGRHGPRGSLGGACPRGKTTGTVLRLCVKTVASGPTNPEKNAGPSTKSAFIVETWTLLKNVQAESRQPV